jgi:plastocyanin
MVRAIGSVLVAGVVLLATACSGTASSSPGSSTAGGSASAPTVGTGGAANGAGAPTRPAAPSPSALAGATSTTANPSATTSSSGAGPTVNLTDANQFAPTTLTVARGATVTWSNTGQTTHTVTDDPSLAAKAADAVLPSGAQAWNSDNLAGGATYSHTFDVPGQYTYFCIPHESLGTVARITVSG